MYPIMCFDSRPAAAPPRAAQDFYSTSEVAAILGGLSTGFVRGEIRDGRLAAEAIRRPGKRAVYKVSDAALRAYVRAHCPSAERRLPAAGAPS